MSSKRSSSKVKIQVPKHRRNMAEVRPYNELPAAANKSDQWLLWGTFALLTLVLAGGGWVLWRNAQAPEITPLVLQTAMTPPEILQEANRFYVEGDSAQSVSRAQVALALEQANPSTPPLEPRIRRSLALAHQSLGHYPEALEHWDWLRARRAELVDEAQAGLARSEVNRLQQSTGLEQLRQAETLLTQGDHEKALAQARQARRTLETHQANKAALQAAHLVVANAALSQGNARQALLELSAASELGPLSPQHQALLQRLQSPKSSDPKPAPSKKAAAQMQVRVTIPQLSEGPAYPVSSGPGRPQRPPVKRPAAKRPPPEVAESESEGPAANRSKRPGLELPKLRYPNQGSSASSAGSLPTYNSQRGESLPGYGQSNNSDSLPTYNSSSRDQGRLPGY